MKNFKSPDTYLTQAEYVTYCNVRFMTLGLEDSIVIREIAKKTAKEAGIVIKLVSGSGLNKGRKTPSLPKHVWESAYEEFKMDK